MGEGKLFKNLREKLKYLLAMQKFAEGAVGKKFKAELEQYNIELQDSALLKLTNAKDETHFDELKEDVIKTRHRRGGILEAASFLHPENLASKIEEVEDAIREQVAEEDEEDEYEL